MLIYTLSKSQTLIASRPSGIGLRNQDKIKSNLSRPNTEKYIKAPFCRGVKLWDRLPVISQKIGDKKELKNILKSLDL